MIEINLLQYQSQLDIRKGKKLFDPIRKKEIIITPEELVRQLLLIHLIETLDYPKAKISVEKQVMVNGLPKRFDVLIYDKVGKPYLLIECKAPNVKIDQAVLLQVARYNLVLNVQYFIMTNGTSLYFGKINVNDGSVEYLDKILRYEELEGFL